MLKSNLQILIDKYCYFLFIGLKKAALFSQSPHAVITKLLAPP